jgi:hypothetical protein
MPKAHGRSPPVDAARAGKITSKQKDIFTNDRCWAIDDMPIVNLVPKQTLEGLVKFHARNLTAASRKLVAPARGSDGAKKRPSDGQTTDGDDEDDVSEDSDTRSDCSSPTSSQEHMISGRPLRQMQQHESLPSGSYQPESPTSPNEQHNIINTPDLDAEQPPSSVLGSVESEASSDKPLETAVSGVLRDSRNVNVTPTSAQPQPIIPCTPDVVIERTAASCHHPMKQTAFLRKIESRLEVPQTITRPERARRAAPIETVPTSSHSSPSAARTSNAHPLPRTSQSSPTRGEVEQDYYTLPRQKRRSPSPFALRKQSATIPTLKPHQPVVIDIDSSAPEEPAPADVLPPQPPAVKSPYESYHDAYPDYKGDLDSFIEACECVTHYQRTLSAPEFLFDDLVRVFETQWRPYTRQQRQRGEDSIALVHYYNANVRAQVYTKGILTKTVLADIVCPDLHASQATHMLLPASRDGLAESSRTVPDPPLQLEPIITSHTTSFHSPTSHAPVSLFEPAPTFMPPPPKAIAVPPIETTTSAATDTPAATTIMAPPAITSARAFAAKPRPDHHHSRRSHVPAIAGQKRRASSPSGSVASRRSSSGSSSVFPGASRSFGPSLVTMGDPSQSTPGTANWSSAKKKKKRTHPLTCDPITTSQQSRA